MNKTGNYKNDSTHDLTIEVSTLNRTSSVVGKPTTSQSLFYRDKKVLILGLGLNEGGVGSARFFAKQGAKLRVTDLKSKEELKPSLDDLSEFENIEYILGKHQFSDIDWADIIVRNPSLKPDNKYRKYAESSGKKVETDIGIFLEFVSREKIIGVTGTKGKTTTASLIYEAIKDTIPNSILAGNIGKSVLDTLELVNPDTLLVLELSSFHLEGFDLHKVSPKYALITNILPDHLNYYSSMEEYTKAKKVIANYQTREDFLLIKSDDKTLNSPEFLSGIKSQIYKFSLKDLPENFNGTLPGEHNLLNYAAGLAVAKKLGIDTKKALLDMKRFQGAQFRLEKIYEQGRLKIYNDTTATNPSATISALKAFNNCYLICGGVDKGLPFEELADQIDRSCKAVYFLDGDATHKIKSLIKHKNIIRSTYVNLESLLNDLRLEADGQGVILFSPAAASFNMFNNEFDRGRQFNAAVKKLFN